MNKDSSYKITDWLPTTLDEVKKRGWKELDVILFSGDAYVDHPSFGHAVIGRIIEAEGYKIAIVPQPNWRDDLRDFKKLGKPRLFFGVTAGCMDSMVNHYTANKRLRSNDAYTPDGKAGFRPDYTTIVYSNIIKNLFPDTPLIIGGVEASLRRLTHYDYWSNQLKPSILLNSRADILVYGMGEKSLKEILKRLDNGSSLKSLYNIPQIAYISDDFKKSENNKSSIEINSHENCLKDKKAFASNFKTIEQESNKVHAQQIIQKSKGKLIVINPPYPVMTEQEIDTSFDLPYTRLPHPKYKKRGSIPAYDMIRHSVNMHRGCFGGCSFCTISAHQGKFVSSRSEKSILKEIDAITKMPDFKGYISDLGGPSANMYKMKGIEQLQCDKCIRPSCIYPNICKNLNTNHGHLLNIYKKTNNHPAIKKAFVGSGIRYDMIINRPPEENKKFKYKEYTEQLIKHHVSGRLKVAPEHTSNKVLKQMRKASFKHFISFKKLFDQVNTKFNLKQQLIPYFISSHPASKLEDMAELAVNTKDLGFQLEQIQDFTPTPMTLATVIYYSGIDPYTLKSIYTAKSKDDKLNQRKFFFWYKRENWQWIKNALNKLNRPDLATRLLPNKK
jgi:uncharacterized radical SAM protein YgiQ